MRDVSRIKPSEEMETLYRMYPQEMETKIKMYRRFKKGVPSYDLKRDNKYKNKLIWKVKNVGAKVVVIGSIIVCLGGFMSNIELSNEPVEMEAVVVTPESVNSGNNSYTHILEGVNLEVSEEEKEVSTEQQFQQEMAVLVKEYSKIYEVDYDVVYGKICELTDDFMDEKFLESGYISGVTCKGCEVYTANRELSILTAVRAISQLPERFGLTEEQLYTGESYDSGIPYEQLIARYADIFEVSEYRNLAYGIFRAETGGNSSLLVNHNNYGGLRNSSSGGGFDHQSNRDKGAIEFIATLRYQPKYAPSFENDGEQWVSNVNWNAERADEVFGGPALSGNSNGLK